MIKFKFQNKNSVCEFDEDDLYFHQITDSPLPYNNLPEGEYMIRGNKKGQRKKYHKVKDKWYLIENVIKDNGHYYSDSSTYMLFPILSEKEWDNIKKVDWKRLNKLWQRHYFGYTNWKYILNLIKEMKLDMYKFDKNYVEK